MTVNINNEYQWKDPEVYVFPEILRYDSLVSRGNLLIKSRILIWIL